MGMRLAVVALAAVLALAPRAGADAATTCRGWLRSRGHRRNILDRHFTRIGGGYAVDKDGPIFVQNFAAKAGDSAR